MTPLSYLSPKTEVRESEIHGRGLFATADIAKDEIVAVKGGHIISRKQLREKVTPRLGPVEIQIGKDRFIAPVTEDEREMSMLYSNQSCDANLGMRGEITFVAMRDIRAGEELTHDWATTDDDDYSVECKCGSPPCLFLRLLIDRGWIRHNAGVSRHIRHVDESSSTVRRLPPGRRRDNVVALLLGIIDVIGVRRRARPIRVGPDLHKHGPQIAVCPLGGGSLLEPDVASFVIEKANRYVPPVIHRP